jgi:hypothetical protein
VPLGDDLINVFSLGGREGREAEVIDDEEIWSQIFLRPFLPGVIGPSSQKGSEEQASFSGG